MCLVSYVILQRIFIFEDENNAWKRVEQQKVARSTHQDSGKEATLTFVKVVIQGVLDLFAGLETTDGRDLRG